MCHGFLQGLCTNIHKRLDEQFYKELKKKRMMYMLVGLKKYIKHLGNIWFKLDTLTVKKIKNEYFQEWQYELQHITGFGKFIDNKQDKLHLNAIIFTDTDKLWHYTEQVYVRNIFNRQNMIDWKELVPDEKDWDRAKIHFKIKAQ